MKTLFARLLKQFDARSIRERILIGLTLFAVTWALWMTSIGALVLDNKTEVVTRIDRLAADLALQSREQQRLRRADKTPVRRALTRQQQRLQEFIVVQQAELDDLLTRFIPPEEVPVLLEDVLRGFAGLKLIRLVSQPAEPLLLQTAEAGQYEQDGEAAPAPLEIYRHPVHLEFEGGYMQVLAYLAALEAGEWHFTWRKFDYAVREYPKAQVVLEIETLSREREWLGV